VAFKNARPIFFEVGQSGQQFLVGIKNSLIFWRGCPGPYSPPLKACREVFDVPLYLGCLGLRGTFDIRDVESLKKGDFSLVKSILTYCTLVHSSPLYT